MKQSTLVVSSALLLAVIAAAVYFLGTIVKKGVTTPSDSPVVVRGGATTIRTRDSNGWLAGSTSETYCTYVAVPTGKALTLLSTGVDRKGALTPAPVLPASVPLTGSWTVTVVGRVHYNGDSSTNSSNGVILKPGDASCSSYHAPSGSVLVELTTNSQYSGYYASDHGLHEESGVETAKRFMDTTPTNVTTTNCVGPAPKPGNPGDEDACERASLITASTNGNTYSGWCTNGECVLGIVAQ